MRNSRATLRDMIISLAVLLVPCALIYTFFSSTPDEPPVPTVDWKPVVAQAEKQATYQVLSPQALPDTWKAIRAQWSDTQLQLGFRSPEDVYYGEKQLAGAHNAGFVSQTSREAHADGTSRVNGRTWTRMVTDDDRTRCLVNVVDGTKAATTVVCADTTYEGIEAFVSTLA